MATVSAAAWVLQGWIVCQSVHEQGTEPLIAPDELPSACWLAAVLFISIQQRTQDFLTSHDGKEMLPGQRFMFPYWT